MEPIAHMYTDMPQKFGIPRNSFVAPHLQGRIVFEPEFAVDAAVDGLEEFTHLWVIWQFENGEPGGTAKDIPADAKKGGATAKQPTAVRDAASTASTTRTARKWSPTVRPPRLGGSKRKGVFATRSPFRPNPIGLTCVTLDHIEFTDAGPVIHVLGADLRDGTPIFDIKPYIPYADSHPEATGGWIEHSPWKVLEVVFPDELQKRIEPSKVAGLIEVLRQDPRRAGSKHEPDRIYRMAYAGRDIAFKVDRTVLTVVEVY